MTDAISNGSKYPVISISPIVFVVDTTVVVVTGGTFLHVV
jgi:hypothetical protein